jgi:ribosomal protein S18 acetylase RimI-like enzyme
MTAPMQIRDVRPDEHQALGRLLVDVYSQLEGFPSPAEQPRYYAMLANIGTFTMRRDARVLVAIAPGGELWGGVVYFGDMSEYGSGGTATLEQEASGIRLLGVNPDVRGRGIGRALSLACIELAREKSHRCVVLHTTQPMRAAWSLYESLGFRRAPDLDFMQEALPVFGFRLALR